MDEQSLAGGNTLGLVRVGDTVRRPAHDSSPYVRDVLLHLEKAEFAGSPRLLGEDEHGREILTYIPGETVKDDAPVSDARLKSAARLIRAFHDATAGAPVADGGEVVCHGDLGPHNTVFDGELAIGLIDWDDELAPGTRLHDLGHAVWCFANVADPGCAIAEQARRTALFCAAYGWDDPAAVLAEITARFERTRDAHRAAGRTAAEAVFADLASWMRARLPELRAALR
ncbi:phosphotransferase [Actinocorallia sp. A-T 12471]|uniref:phosphotransferase n=1 Tax=Actinocorallia sp. A-T 12471 TaxID=3089813 RepID=UPI0029CF8F92|nr:phosphotransferase [Actinocorallia sp. A-T 12471]MDX6739169.1 phosphotransferase [Actinocorallia sp. A-T 12471]